MPSSNKTDYLQLNSFIGTDKPKMSDFNYDNAILDNHIKSHEQDATLHLDSNKLSILQHAEYVVGTYTGTGNITGTVSLGFKPKFGFYCVVGKFPAIFSFDTMSNQKWFGFFSELGCSAGITLTDTGFTVKQTIGESPDALDYYLNVSGQSYFYVAFK